jgi:Lrp/AsnC family transcriptional regulator
MYKLDDTDKKLLRMLQQDAKTSINELSARLNLTKSPVYDRIKRYEKLGIIQKYVAILDAKKLNSRMVVFCSVSLENQKLEAIEAFGLSIENLPEVVECYLMGGANDFLLKIVVKDLQAYHQFSSGVLASLPNIAQIKSTFVLNEIKQSTASLLN